tara:strand:- start:3594 stop:4286 length:693 start_codon:yes stop_codon:yes gene_type:complete
MLIQEVTTDVQEGVNDPHIFKAVFMAGGPGSGKSYVAKKLLSMTGLKSVNSDTVMELLFKKQDLELNPDTIASPQGQEVRQTAKRITKNAQEGYLDGRLGLVIDGTGKDVGKINKQSEKLQELGYDTMMIFVNTSLDVAQERNTQRARSLPADMVQTMWREVQDNIMKFQQGFGASNFHIVDNSGGLEDPARKENFDQVYKTIQKFINTPPSKRQAKAWIKNAQQAKTQG